jgi:ribosomal protein S18 acetylase RimI-like enzyme
MPAPYLAFRPATQADADYLWLLRELTMRPYVEPVRGWHVPTERSYSDDLEGCHVILDGAAPVGAYQVKRWPAEFHLSRLQIHPSRQRQGLGARVVIHLQHTLAHQHLPFTLQVISSNPARHLYERLGFQTTARRDHQILMRWLPPGAPQP